MPERRLARTRESYELKADPQSRINEAVRLLDYYAEQSAYGDAVLFAKAALLDVPVDTLLDMT